MIDSGCINVYKPQNMTSHDVVAIMRRTLGIKRIGHTGTLDPMATGALPICIGRATKVIEYLDMDIKEYRCTLTLGIVTDTQDIWGEVIETRDVSRVTEEDIKEAFSGFKGVISQKPPMYSALKVNGKKLYEYAREGKSVDVKSRNIYIKELEVDYIDLSSGEVSFVVQCSKGTYIRTICQDVGQRLGCGAVMTSLERSKSGVFHKENSIDIEILRNMTPEEIEKYIVNADEVLEFFGEAELDPKDSLKFLNGMRISVRTWVKLSEPYFASNDFPLEIREEFRRAYKVYGDVDGKRRFLGIGFESTKDKHLKADKIFYIR